MIKLKTPVTLNTVGDGYWSSKAAAVKVIGLHLAYLDEENKFGELRVVFNTKTWNVQRDGLIYTDSQFERELKKFLKTIDLKPASVSYSEQGMQGDNYVSLDVGKSFIDSWMKKFTVTV